MSALRAINRISCSSFSHIRPSTLSSLNTAFSSFSYRSFAVKVGERRFTKDHEYVLVTGASTGTVGITDFAQKELGDVVYVELPESGVSFKKGDSFGSVESVKAASSVYAPIDMLVKSINTKLKDDCALVNRAAESEGWMLQVEIKNTAQLDALMDAEAYKKHTETSKH